MQGRDGVKEVVKEALKRLCEAKGSDGATAEEINEEIAKILGRRLSKGAIYTAIRELEESGEIERVTVLRPYKYRIAKKDESGKEEEKGEEKEEKEKGAKGEEKKEEGKREEEKEEKEED